ncbi:MAG: hypothetical protein K9H06_16990, partial [Melioribacteraceae bacterium]|nr:hypothetical protein [Melioribacteraceae bacterium]
MRKAVLSFMIIFAFFQNDLFAQQTDPHLEELINRAIEVSPKLNALRNKRSAADATVPQVSNLPDPILTL